MTTLTSSSQTTRVCIFRPRRQLMSIVVVILVFKTDRESTIWTPRSMLLDPISVAATRRAPSGRLRDPRNRGHSVVFVCSRLTHSTLPARSCLYESTPANFFEHLVFGRSYLQSARRTDYKISKAVFDFNSKSIAIINIFERLTIDCKSESA